MSFRIPLTDAELSRAASLGDAVSGFAAGMALLLAPVAITWWLAQKRRERRSEAAIQIYSLVIKATEALRLLTHPVVVTAQGDTAERMENAEHVEKILLERLRECSEGFAAMEEAASLAALLLDERHQFHISGLLGTRAAALIHYKLIHLHITEGDEAALSSAANEVWSLEARNRLDDIEASIRDSLVPVAQFHMFPLLSTIQRVMARRARSRAVEKRARKRG